MKVFDKFLDFWETMRDFQDFLPTFERLLREFWVAFEKLPWHLRFLKLSRLKKTFKRLLRLLKDFWETFERLWETIELFSRNFQETFERLWKIIEKFSRDLQETFERLIRDFLRDFF